MAVEQTPSPWAVFFSLTDENGVKQDMFWDYVEDGYFTWAYGVFLVWRNGPSPDERICGVDQYPPTQSGPQTPQEKLVDDCKRRFNETITERFFSSDEPHPIEPEVYEYLLSHLIWDTTTQRFI